MRHAQDRNGRRRDWGTQRYVREMRCDCCGRPVAPLRRFTDEEACGSSDGPGFWICHRQDCARRRTGLTVDQRRELYAHQRLANEARTR